MTGLPRKYAKMGFKKGWKAYKSKGKTTTRKTTRSSIKVRQGGKMRRRKSSTKNPTSLVLGGIVYGGVRNTLSNYLMGMIGNMFPSAPIVDEIALGTTAYLVHKKAKSGMVKDIAKSALIIESSRIGEALASGSALFGTNGITKTSGYPV